MWSRVSSVASRAATAGFCLLLASAEPLGDERLVLTVLLSDRVGVGAAVAEDTRRTLARIFDRLNVAVAWLGSPCDRCRPDAHQDPAAYRVFMQSIYVVRLVERPGPESGHGASARALAYAAPGTRVATVVLPRIEQKAATEGGSVAVALGHVIGHELGHLLLRQREHSATGLMHAELDMQLAAQGRLLFTEQQARTIRASLAEDAARTR